MTCVSDQTGLTGSCDSGHSLPGVGPCSFFLLGHRGLAATQCAADRGWPSVSDSSVTSLLHPPLSSPASFLTHVLWDKMGVKSNSPGGTGMQNMSRISCWGLEGAD